MTYKLLSGLTPPPPPEKSLLFLNEALFNVRTIRPKFQARIKSVHSVFLSDFSLYSLSFILTFCLSCVLFHCSLYDKHLYSILCHLTIGGQHRWANWPRWQVAVINFRFHVYCIIFFRQ